MARHDGRAGEKRSADSPWGCNTSGWMWAPSFADHCGTRDAVEQFKQLPDLFGGPFVHLTSNSGLSSRPLTGDLFC